MGNNKSAGSEEHKNLINVALKYFDAEIIIVKGNNNIKGKYFPDLITENTDIECELLKNSYLKKKIDKWDKKRKKILIIGIPRIVLDNFDEIYCIDNQNELTRIF